jgi:mRNA interferase RelE/StbE
MNEYKYRFRKSAKKFIESQPKKQQTRILKAVYKLPHEGDVKELTNRKGYYRLRVGTYRIIYTIQENILTVEVLNVGSRGDVYK